MVKLIIYLFYKSTTEGKSRVKGFVIKYFKKLDYFIILTMTILICVGLYCTQQAFKQDDNLKTIVIKQLAGVVAGYFIIIIIAFIDYHLICTLSSIFYIIMMGILGITLVIGSNLNHVRRWIMIMGIPFQPSELTKIVLILFLAFLCNHFKSKFNKLYVFFILAAVVALPMTLILLEPHLSSSLAILFIFCIIVYSSGIHYMVIGKALALVLPVVLVVLIGVTQFNLKLPFIEKYQVGRVLSFLSTDESESLTGDYQQLRSIEAIGSGGLHGKMISTDEEVDREYSTIYAKESDFVFAIIGEEFGFIGSFFIILLYGVLVIRCLIISYRVTDYIGKLICIGVSGYLMFQIFVNVGVATKLLPNTGLPLPFVSYGLTSLISSMIAIGLVINVGIRQKGRV